MPKQTTIDSAAALLEQLKNNHHTVDDTTVDFIIQRQKEWPLYLSILIAAGALFASFFFIAFFVIIAFASTDFEPTSLITLGIMFMAGAIGLYAATGHSHTIKDSFLLQFSFASMVTGKTLFVFIIGELGDYGWSIPLALFIATSISYPLYRLSVERFVSVLTLLIFITLNITTG